MANIKPKWGRRASYWVPAFTLDAKARQCISTIVGKQAPEFYKDLEIAVSDFLAWTEYQKSAPTPANVEAAVNDVSGKVRALAEVLSAKTGMDGRTRQYIKQAWMMRGMSGDVIADCEAALTRLEAATALTRKLIKSKIRKGRKIDSKLEFVHQLSRVFRRHGLKATASRNGKFENCIVAILDAIAYPIGEDTIHSLALKTAKTP